MMRDNKPYPVNALPKMLYKAGCDVAEKLQCSDEIIAQAMQAVVAASVQSSIEVDVPLYGPSPTNMWFLTVAGSAEGKDSASKAFRAGFERFSDEIMDRDKDIYSIYSAQIDIWSAERDGIKRKLRAQAGRGEDVEGIKSLLTEHNFKKPVMPTNHCLSLDNFDDKSLVASLSHSKFVFIESTEGASVLNKRAMRNIPWLVKTFSGEKIAFSYGSPNLRSYVVHGALSSMNVMIQPKILGDLLHDKQAQLIESGFLPRFMPAYPLAKRGSRFLTEKTLSFEGVDAFNSRVYDVLNESSYFKNRSEKKIQMVFSPQARSTWIDVRNEIESAMAPGRLLFSVPEFAGRIANNVARMAANWHYFQHGTAEISACELSAAEEVCRWHAFEFVRMFSDEMQMFAPEEDAIHLEKFLRRWFVQRNIWQWPIPPLQRNSPRPIRHNNLRLMDALAVLESQGKVKRINIGADEMIQLTTYFNCAPNVNPQMPLLQCSAAI